MGMWSARGSAQRRSQRGVSDEGAEVPRCSSSEAGWFSHPGDAETAALVSNVTLGTCDAACSPCKLSRRCRHRVF